MRPRRVVGFHPRRGYYELAPQQRPEQTACRGALLEVALVVVLGAPEGGRRLDLGHDRVTEALLGALDNSPRDLGLLVRVGEDHRAVLPADVGALTVELSRVVDLEILRDQVLVADLRGVEGDLADLDVPRRAGTDLLVGGVVDVPALVADRRVDDAVDLPEGGLHLPEAAGAKGCLLGSRRAVLAGHRAPSIGLDLLICPLVTQAGVALRPLPRVRRPARLLLALDQPDQVPLRVAEQGDLHLVHDLLGPEHAGGAQALGLLERLLDVVNRDVEGDVPVGALRSGTDPTADPDVAVRVALTTDHPVVHRVVGVDLPSEQVRVEAMEL